MPNLKDAAYQYKKMGFSFYPQTYKVKKSINGQAWTYWQQNLPTDKDIEYQFSDDLMPRNIAIVTGTISGNLVCLDFDNETTYKKWAEKYPLKTAVEKSSRGYHVLFRVENMPKFSHGLFEGSEVEVKGNAQDGEGTHCFTAWPSVHESGHEYFWIIPPWQSLLTLNDLSEIGIEPMKPILEEFEPIELNLESKLSRYMEVVLENELGRLKSCSNGNRNNQLFKTAAHIYGFVKTGNLSKADADDQIKEVCRQIGLFSSDERQKTHDTLESAWERAKPQQIPNNTPDNSDWLSDSKIKNFFYKGEVGDAEMAYTLLKNECLFDANTKTWYVWEKHYWVEDMFDRVNLLISNLVSAQYLHLSSKLLQTDNKELSAQLMQRVSQLRTKKRIKDVKELLHTFYEEIGLIKWDSNHMLFACQNGIIDLGTGELRDGQRTDYIKNISEVTWEQNRNETWEAMIAQVWPNNQEMISFIKRLYGYTLTGKVSEKIFPILYGAEGWNGRTTQLETLAKIFGPMSIPNVSSKIMEDRDTRFNSDGPDVTAYSLKGVRLAWVSDPNLKKLSEALIKRHTGGDSNTARTLYMKKNETFDQTYKLLLLTNTKPELNSDDQSIWERVLLIPFNQSFVKNPNPDNPNEHLADLNLAEKLRANLSGILTWLIEGCLEWQKDGLNPPDEVKYATEEYRAELDYLGQFIDEKCVKGTQYKVQHKEILDAYNTWCESNDAEPLKSKKFGEKMGKLFKVDNSNVKYYLGISLSDGKTEQIVIFRKKEPDF